MQKTEAAPPVQSIGAASLVPENKRSGVWAYMLAHPALILGFIIMLGLVLRLYRLDARSLWLDEMVTAHVRQFDHINQLFGYLHYFVDNTPVTYLVTWLMRGFEGTEVVLRLPDVVAGTLCIPAIYFLGKTLVRPRVGLLAAALMTVLPYAVWYSQEARAYSFLMLFTILQMLFAYRAVVFSGWYNWLALSFFTILNIYTHNLALLVTLAMSIFVGVTLLIEVMHVLIFANADAVARRQKRVTMARKLALAFAAALLTTLAYLPWLPTLQQFLQHSNLGFGQVAGTAPPTLNTLGVFLVALDLVPVMLLLALAGLIVSIYQVVHGPRTAGILLLLWLLLPLVVYWLSVSVIMVNMAPRYYALIYPALLLFAALGVDALAEWIIGILPTARFTASRGSRRGIAGIALFSALALLLMAQALPALAASYSLPKEDYRGVASFIRSTSQPDAVVLTMGMKDVIFFPESLQYYFDLQHSPIVAVDARTLDVTTARRLVEQKSDVWAVVYHGPDAAGIKEAEAQGLEVTTYPGMSLVHVRTPGLSPVEQAQALLRWGSISEPKLLTTSSLLDAISGKATLGPNLLPPFSNKAAPGDASLTPATSGQTVVTDIWTLPAASSTLSSSGELTESVSEDEVNTTINISQVQAGKSYVLSFLYRNGALNGSQRFYVSAHNGDDWLDTFPGGLGFLCDPSTEWKSDGFAFTVPQNSAYIKVWLRVTGKGSAEFEDVELKEIR